MLDAIQDRVHRKTRQRLDTTSIYIRNAVSDRATKPGGSELDWPEAANREVQGLQSLLESRKPTLLISFGAFSFEFARRALREEPRQRYSHWSSKGLGEEFPRRIGCFDPRSVNAVCLLHASIARGRFIQGHDQFCGEPGANYFERVGLAIADVLIRHRDQLPIWVQ